jgi:hypothetical protein
MDLLNRFVDGIYYMYECISEGVQLRSYVMVSDASQTNIMMVTVSIMPLTMEGTPATIVRIEASFCRIYDEPAATEIAR